MRQDLTTQEENVRAVIIAAREVQEFLWGHTDPAASFGWEEWLRILRKRVVKLEELETTGKHWKVEARKRLLQMGAISVALLSHIERQDFRIERDPGNQSNHEAYAERLEAHQSGNNLEGPA